MTQAPLVSILIPAFNPRFFRHALNSALTQTYGNLEVIVCDDCRTEEIKDIVDALADTTHVALRYVRNPQRLGFVGNLLNCLAQAQGEFIKFLCDDDRLFPGCITLQAKAMTENPEASLVLAQRLLWDADDIQLPSRLENTPLAPVSGLFKGDDMLAIFESFPFNFLGGFTSALFRRADVQVFLPALTQAEQGFAALLDLALYVCMLRRGNLIVLNQILSVERLYPDRLIRQQPMRIAAATEMKWLVQMLEARSGESAPAKGWVRFVDLARADQTPRVWEEVALGRTLGSKQAVLPTMVGTDSHSFAELYGQWLACRTLSGPQQLLLPDTLSSWPRQPKIVAIVIDEHASSSTVQTSLHSLNSQLYAPELILVLSSACNQALLEEKVFTLPLENDWVTQVNALLPQLDGAQWFYLLRAGDRLVESALLMLAERIVTHPQAHCFYSDEGALREGESADPVFKPDFNLDLLRSYPYVGRALAFQRERFLALGGFDSSYGELAPHDLLWRLIEVDGIQAVGHIADILLESRFSFSQWLALPEVVEQNGKVVGAHLQRLGVAHGFHESGQTLVNRINYTHTSRPLVSIVIIHKDQLAALQRCVETLLEKTAYSAYEVLIADNGSHDADTLAWLADIARLGGDKLRVLQCPATNSQTAARNFAATQARGDYLLMLNPYAVITHADWLDELLCHGQRPEVAVVGGKLFGPDGNIVHAGLILGLQGYAGVPFRGEHLNASGYMRRLQVAQNLTAVGPDCLLIRKQVFDSVGGLDDVAFTQAFSEVDLCLRVRQNGYLVVWTPHALMALGAEPVLIPDAAQELLKGNQQQVLFQRWLPIIARDPAYNPSLTLDGYSYRLDPGFRTGWSPFSTRQLPCVLALPVNATAIGHYRVTQPLLELEAVGRIVGRISYESLSVIEVERQSPDVIILQGRYYEERLSEISTLKTYSNARRIYELDDYVISVPHKNGHARHMPTNMEAAVRRGIGLCDRVVVSTQPLADALSSMHHDIRVVPNMLEQRLWSGHRSQRRTSQKPRVGWGGGTSHGGDLEIIAEVVRTLADQVDWVFFGMCPDELRPYLKEFHGPVSLHAYPAKLASLNLDLALAPLEYHIFNDCKSNLRLLEYGACGYPVICTDTLAYRGYLPCTRVYSNSTAEWLEAIRMHLADPDASYRMGDELREAVLRDYVLRGNNLQNWVNGWLAD